MRHLSFDAGDVIFREGSYDATMYEITSGAVEIIAHYESPNQTVLATISAGETFGEMGLIEFWSRSATAVATEDGTEVDEIDRDEYLSYFKGQPYKVLTIMRQLSARLRETNEKYQEACATVFEAVEAERAQQKRSASLRSRLSNLLKQLTDRSILF